MELEVVDEIKLLVVVIKNTYLGAPILTIWWIAALRQTTDN